MSPRLVTMLTFVAIGFTSLACEPNQPRAVPSVDVSADAENRGGAVAPASTDREATHDPCPDTDKPPLPGLKPGERPDERVLLLQNSHWDNTLFVYEGRCPRELDSVLIEPYSMPIDVAEVDGQVRVIYEDGRIRVGLGDDAKIVPRGDSEGHMAPPWVLSNGNFAARYQDGSPEFHYFNGSRWSAVALKGAAIGDKAIFVESSGPSELMVAGREGVASYDLEAKQWYRELDVLSFPRALKRDSDGRMFFVERGRALVKEGKAWRVLLDEPAIGFDAVVVGEDTWISGLLEQGEYREGVGRVFFKFNDGAAVEHSRSEGEFESYTTANYPPTVFGKKLEFTTSIDRHRGGRTTRKSWVFDGEAWSLEVYRWSGRFPR